ncbi:endonuclease YncB(thermonuclease family) [Aquimarina sp. EL_43]|uniref:thermonuclease family protein n=1 Tax=unclassified Aquimarina TaxID=2627091 RepID=UPI001A2B3510|nr:MULTISPECIES: thermonuclease family protein [unclassified Aquimarina]MBG6129404.1 endonuclease YncB(thermonuclease family) [Aquimarina sp. EL_35]MBG6150469.1 endonuclease YncB(thermonuclease family) [Aquimarina sp. EL_32]MBG6168223.1 endonuclease YncB(thermonuclease family) [Aquimarina sp. EL_43]
MKLTYFKYLCILVLCLSFSSVEKLPQEFFAKVIGVKDGDTIEVLYNKEPIIIRLAHIDCPEKKQPFGQKAKQFVSDFCFDKEVKIITKGKFDRYRRLIAVVQYKNKILNKQLVANGYALHFKKYSKDTTYNILEKEARFYKKGMWSQKELIEPWLFRKRKVSKKAHQ